MDARESDPWSEYQVTGLESTGASVRTKCWRGSSPNGVTRMLLDMRTTLLADAGTSGRITERRTVIRRRFQNGCLTIKGKGQKMWVARWRETVLQPDNTLGKVLRSKVLGPVSQISKSEARNLLANCLRSTNQGHKRPLAMITFEQFAREKWEPLALPTIKPATARYYRYQLHRYLLPTFGPLRLCEPRPRDVAGLCDRKKAAGLLFLNAPRNTHYAQQGFGPSCDVEICRGESSTRTQHWRAGSEKGACLP